MADHSGLAVIELRSKDNRAGSLRAHFELIAEASFDQPYEFSCEIVSTKPGLESALRRWLDATEIKYLCIAGHGNKRGVRLEDGKYGTAQTVIRSLTAVRAPQLRGLHLSVCQTVTRAFAAKLLKGATSLTWVSGYHSDADWIQSLALDMLFLRLLLDSNVDETEERLIWRVAKEVGDLAPGLAEKLGMHIYCRRRDGRIEDLLRRMS